MGAAAPTNINDLQKITKQYQNVDASQITMGSAQALLADKNPSSTLLPNYFEKRVSDYPLGLPIEEEITSIIIGIDVTASMGVVPESLVKGALTTLFNKINAQEIPHPQLSFIAIGDAPANSQCPIQMTQFETAAAPIVSNLTRLCLEGGGGNNRSESYPLAWLAASRKTDLQSYDKSSVNDQATNTKKGEWRWQHGQTRRRGILITIGDDGLPNQIYAKDIKKFIDPTYSGNSLNSHEILEEIKEKFHVAHIHVKHNYGEQDDYRQAAQRSWEECFQQANLGESLQICHHTNIGEALETIVKNAQPFLNTAISINPANRLQIPMDLDESIAAPVRQQAQVVAHRTPIEQLKVLCFPTPETPTACLVKNATATEANHFFSYFQCDQGRCPQPSQQLANTFKFPGNPEGRIPAKINEHPNDCLFRAYQSSTGKIAVTFVEVSNCDKFIELLNFNTVFDLTKLPCGTIQYRTKLDDRILCKRHLKNAYTGAQQNQTLYFEPNHPCIQQGRALIIHPEAGTVDYSSPTRLTQAPINFHSVMISFNQLMDDVISSRTSNTSSPPQSPLSPNPLNRQTNSDMKSDYSMRS